MEKAGVHSSRKTFSCEAREAREELQEYVAAEKGRGSL